MDFRGRYHIPAPPEAVWEALHNPIALAAAIPGCEAVDKISDREFKASATVKIGPVKARFQGKVSLTPSDPPAGFVHAVTLQGEGQGGAAGFARGESGVRLAKDGEGTVLEYDAKAVVGGRLAQLGQRLIDGAAKSLADEFFANFVLWMQRELPAPARPPAAAPSSKEEGLAPQIWVAGLIGIIILLIILFGIVL